MFIIEFNENISCGPVPDEVGMKELSQRGVKTIVDLSTDGEVPGGKDPQRYQNRGLHYVRLPLAGDGLSEEKLSRFYQTVFDQDEYPVFVCGEKAIRPVALLLTISALKEGKTVMDILEEAKTFKPPLEHVSEVVKFVEAFFRHRKGHDGNEAIAADVIERWLKPKNRGVLLDANGSAKVTGPCGDTIEIYLRIKEEEIEKASFLTNGCPNSAACASMGAELAEGRSLGEAYDLTHDNIIDSFTGLPKEEQHCAKLTIIALRQAIDEYFKAQKKERQVANPV